MPTRNYRIMCGGELIGRSALESRDPGMGTARGRFVPAVAYVRVRPVFRLFAEAQSDAGWDNAKIAEYYRRRDALLLSVETEEGRVVPTTVVHIEDYMDEVDEDACEVEVHFADRASFDAVDSMRS